ncbi:hypothetical protein BJ742DRAFT_471609 [Cladochytrium replicatum]|nr:hypothetical protein BJ742DRAFT_471609 [Cladochytrium replicatum]
MTAKRGMTALLFPLSVFTWTFICLQAVPLNHTTFVRRVPSPTLRSSKTITHRFSKGPDSHTNPPRSRRHWVAKQSSQEPRLWLEN